MVGFTLTFDSPEAGSSSKVQFFSLALVRSWWSGQPNISTAEICTEFGALAL